MATAVQRLVADEATGRARGKAAAVPTGLRSALAAVERDTFTVLVATTYAALLLTRLPAALGGDAWLTLLAGRELVTTGLPSHETLTLWSSGREWVDQQWGAQLALYAVEALGGLKALLLANALVLVGSLSFAFAVARRLGASAGATAAVGLAAVVAAFPHGGVRAQTLAYPLFVATLYVLATAVRADRPRRALIALPALVVWANLHGSVLVGVGLVGIYAAVTGVTAARSRDVRRVVSAFAFAAAALACVLVTPNGLEIVEYYRNTVGNPALLSFVGEWQPPVVPDQWPLFALMLGAVALVARARGRLNAFEVATLALLLVAALTAVRYGIWFVLAAAAFLPAAVSPSTAGTARRRPRLNIALVAAALVAVGALAAAALARPTSVYRSEFPAGAASAVGDRTGGDGAARVFAHERLADWLLYEMPWLRGRVAFDARFELLTSDELEAIARWRGRSGDDWRLVANGYELIVLDTATEHETVTSLLRDEHATLVYGDSSVVVVYRGKED